MLSPEGNGEPDLCQEPLRDVVQQWVRREVLGGVCPDLLVTVGTPGHCRSGTGTAGGNPGCAEGACPHRVSGNTALVMVSFAP